MDNDTTACAAPLVLHREAVRAEWLDYNEHMNVAYYVLAFDHATDAFMDHIGLGWSHTQASGGSIFVLEAHPALFTLARGCGGGHSVTR